MKKITTYLLLLCLFVASCSVERRHYRRGFHIERHRHYSISENTEQNKSLSDETQVADSLPGLNNQKTTETIPKKNQVEAVSSEITQNAGDSPSEENSTANNDLLRKELVLESETELKAFSDLTDSTTSDDSGIVKLILGLVLILVGLTPIGVLVIAGTGPEFTTNLILWLGAILFVLVAFVAIGTGVTGGMFFLYLLFAFIAFGLGLMAVIHGLIVFFKNL